MDSPRHDPYNEKILAMKEIPEKKRFSLPYDNRKNLVMQNKTLNPTRSNSSITKSANPILTKISTKQLQVRRSVLRQFDPLLEKFGSMDGIQKTMISTYNEKCGCYDKEFVKAEDSENLSEKIVEAENLVKIDSINAPPTIEKETVQALSFIDNEMPRLPTIEENCYEDLCDATSKLLTSEKETFIKMETNMCHKTQCLASLATDISNNVPSDVQGKFSEKTVEETSSCSSCSSYNSTLEDFIDTPLTLPVYDENPIRAQHYLHRELSLENTLCIENLKILHERNKTTKLMKETYEKYLKEKLMALTNVQLFHQQMNTNLAMGEDTFSTLHSKYNKAKEVINGFHQNKRELEKVNTQRMDFFKKCMEKYQLLDEYVKVKFIAFRKTTKEESKLFEKDLKMMQTTIKHLRIKVSALEQQLAQKRKECQELNNLYSEIIAD